MALRISIGPLDRKFSLYIRERAKWRCERCFRQFTPPTNALHCAHIFSRSRKNTRWDDLNAVSTCYGCHSYLDRNPLEKYDWYIKKFGQKQFDALRLRTNMAEKVDLKAIEIWLKAKIKALEEKQNG